MACYSPLKGYYSKELSTTGKRTIVFNPKKGYPDMPLTVPCGNCIGCRLDRSKQWAIRCVNEASLHEDNCFLTLTYANPPENNELNKEHFQKFMKKLRKKYAHKQIRYFQCGEYGEKLSRPHYHALIFGLDFEDKTFHKEHNGSPLFISEELDNLWGYGHCWIGSVTFESAAYTARYILKKVNGKNATEHYETLNEYGEYVEKLPEYITMSLGNRKPPEHPEHNRGIGYQWIKKYLYDTYKDDFIIVNGRKFKPPRYYDNILKELDPELFIKIKAQRLEKVDPCHEDNSTHRLIDRQTCKIAQISSLRRNYEETNV